MALGSSNWRSSWVMTELDLVQLLLSAIATGDDAATEVASRALAGRRSLVPALRPLLTDVDPDRRWWAVRTLALIGGEDAARLIVERLADSDEATRCAAALGLGQLRYSQAAPALIARLADHGGWVRDSAADALAMLGEAAIAALVEALADHRDGVRVRAASALRRILLAPAQEAGANSETARTYIPAINALFGALNDPNRLVRHHAQQTLDRLGLLETVWVAP
jgi:HEAT repeat protein